MRTTLLTPERSQVEPCRAAHTLDLPDEWWVIHVMPTALRRNR